MNESSTGPKQNKGLAISLGAALVVVLGVAAVATFKYRQATNEADFFKARYAGAQNAISREVEASEAAGVGLEDDEKEIATLQPLTGKPRALPISTRVKKVGGSADRWLLMVNRSAEKVWVKATFAGGGRTWTQKRVMDGQAYWLVSGLAQGETVSIASYGYETITVAIQ